MPSILAGTYGPDAGIGGVGVLGLRGALFSRRARSGKLAHGGAALLKSSGPTNRLIGGWRTTAAACRGKLGKQSTPRTINGRKPLVGPGGRLQCVGSMRPVFRHVFKRARVINKNVKAASGAKGRVVKRYGIGTVQPTGTGRVGDAELTVGLARENDATHAERHPLGQIDRWAKICPRCCFIRWKRTRPKPPWMNSKPAFMSGAWGLGCIWCAASRHSTAVQSRRRAHVRQNKETGHSSQAVSRASKWSAYAMRGLKSTRELYMAIVQHQTADLHRLSDNCFHSPAAHLEHLKDPCGPRMHLVTHSHDLHTIIEPRSSSNNGEGGSPARQEMVQPAARGASEEGSQRRQPACPLKPVCTQPRTPKSTGSALGSATDPFRGRVPQIQGWVDVWAESTSAMSI